MRYRGRGLAEEPRQRFGSQGVEILWTVIPLLVVSGLFVITVRAMLRIDAPQASGQNADLTVRGHQWWWEGYYPNGAIATGDIHIPTGRRLLVRIQSGDVIHDFWAPQLARKMDAIPGRSSYIWLEADAPGTYSGACSEFCGTDHAWMRFRVIAQPETTYNAWLRQQVAPPPQPTGLAAEGARLFREKKCAECHGIAGVVTVSNPERGPDLSHLASRELLGGGIARNTPANLMLWLSDPQAAKPGNHMPADAADGQRADFAARLPGEPAMSERAADGVVAWLGAIDHKRVGILYMLSALLFFLAGGLEAMVMRAQLAAPNLKLIAPEVYNQMFTMHGTTMIFLVAMPVLTGFGVYLVPLMIGANETALPRLGALSFWLQFFGGLLLYFSFLMGGAPNAGWFSYAPLTENAFSTGPGLNYWALALLMITAGSIGAADESHRDDCL